MPCRASTDLPWQKAQGHGDSWGLGTIYWLSIYFSALSCVLFPLLFCLFTIPSNFKSWPMDLAYNLEFAFLSHVDQQLCCDPVSSASAPGTAYCVHSCKKPFPAWHNPSSPPAQSHPGPLRRRRESFLWARQGGKLWERLGAESQLRGRSGFTSKTWVTSSFKGGTVPWSQQFDHLSPSGRLTGAASGICNQQKRTKMSNMTNSHLDWKIN